MGKGRGWAHLCLMGLSLFVVLAPVWAQNVTPEDEYKQRIRVSQDIQPLGEHPFGANINLYNGSLSFLQTDISEAGTGPLLQLMRRFQVKGVGYNDDSGEDGTFGDWDLALPRIETLAPWLAWHSTSIGKVRGWAVGGTPSTPITREQDYAQRCTLFSPPPFTLVSHIGQSDPRHLFVPSDWWNGYHLIIPGQGSQDLLANTGTDQSTYRAVTKNHWRFSCLSTVVNASTNPDTNGDGTVDDDDAPMPTGQGFLAQAPDGTRYWFDELVYRGRGAVVVPLHLASGASVVKPMDDMAGRVRSSLRKKLAMLIGWASGSGVARAEMPITGSDGLYRTEAVLLVTKIQDRFGNTLTYTYNDTGHLTSITANDGRKLTVQYVSGSNTLIHSVTLQPASGAPRVWTYDYDGSGHLASVTLPDGRAWHYDLAALDSVVIKGGSYGTCATLAADGQTQVSSTGSMTHPSGLKATFTVKPIKHGRWNVRAGCEGMLNNDPDTPNSYVDTPFQWYSPTIVTKTFSGAGVGANGTETWNFSYQPATQTWANDYCGTSCASVTTWTDVKQPDGSTLRRTFNNDYSSPFQSKLLRTDFYSGAVGSTLLRSVSNTYASPDTAPLSGVGVAMQTNLNVWQMVCEMPLKQRTIRQWSEGGLTSAAVMAPVVVQAALIEQPPAPTGGGSTDTSGSVDSTSPPPSTPPTYAPFTCPATTAGGGPLAAPRSGGTSYTWQAEAFDKYTHVTKEKRFNSIVGQTPVEEATTYLNDTTHWVLGLPLKHTNLTTGEIVSENAYDSLNVIDRLSSRKHFGQLVMSYTWDAAGQLASFTDANGHTTTLSSYKRGIPQAIGYPDGTSQSLTVDDLGQITSITNQAGITTHYAYDAAGRLTQITYPSGWTPKTFAYTYVTSAERGLGANHWKRTVSQGNARHVTWYDALLRPVLTDTYIDGDSGSHISASTTYNWKGLTTRASWPVSGSPVWGSSVLDPGTDTTYDALGRVTAVSQHSEPDPVTGQVTVTTTKTAYLSGARKQVTDPAGHVTTTSYQVFDTPSYKAVTQVTAPEGIVQTITRNLYGAPTAITQSGSDGQGGTVSLTKHLYYNALHRLCRTDEPETGSTLMGYDAVGNLTWSAEGQTVTGEGCGTEPASHTTRSYDAMNRLTAVSYPDGHGNTTKDYDAMGRVTRVQAATTSGPILWAYAYDTLGHLTSETLSVDSHQWPIHYAYDRSGHVNQLTYPDGKQVAYAPDALGRSTKAGPYATDVSYFPDGSIEYFRLGSGNEYLAQRNTQHLLKNLTYGGVGSTLLYSQDMTYDKDANLLTSTDRTLNGTRTKTLSYDALNRLTQAEAPNLWGTETYTYDALNNIRTLQLTSDDLTHVYQYDTNNQLTGITRGGTSLHTFVHDPQGDITQKDSQTRVFDAAHRLLQIPGVVSYIYDAAGRRVKKTDASGARTYYAYNQAGHLLSQWQADATGAITATTDYIYLGNKLLARIKRNPGDPVINTPGVSIDTNPNNGSYTVSWTPTSGTTYTLQEQVNGGGWSTIYTGTATHKAESGKAGGSYRYHVRTCDGDCSDWGVSAVVGVTPTKPTITLPSGIQPGRYTVSWSRPISTTDFDVQEQANGGSWRTVASNTTATSISLAGDVDGSYAYRVQANNAYGTRGWATSGAVTVLLPPASAPTPSVPAVSGSGSYIVSWNAVSKATSYTLQEQINGGSWSTVSSGSNLSKSFSGKADGHTYGYRVKACNAGGCDAAWSTTAAVKVVFPPSAPTSAYQEVSGSYKLISDFLRWDAVSRATYYQVKLDTSTAVVYSGSDTVYRIDSAVPPDIVPPHTAHLRACNEGGCSDWVTVYAAPPAAPTLAGPSNSTNGSYTLTWDPQQTASSYTLQELTETEGWHTVYSGTSVSKQLTGKSNGTYDYRVQACAMTECGAWSTVFSVTVLLPPTAPASVTAPATSSGDMTVSWSPASTATSYTLRVKINGGSPSTVYSGTATSHTYTVLQSGQYVYEVHACNQSGCSSYTSSRTITVTLPPSVPTLSVPTSNDTGSYTVSWSVIGTATSYTLQQRVNSGSWSTSYSGSATHKSYSGQTNGATYGYRIHACNAGGCGAWSATKSLQVEIPPSMPTDVQITTSGSYKLIKEYVKWGAASGATRYELKLNGLDQATVYSGTATSYLVGSASPPDFPPFVSAAYVRACSSHGCSAWAKNQ